MPCFFHWFDLYIYICFFHWFDFLVDTIPEPERKYFDFNEIRLKIESETDRLAGKRGLTVDAILLDIYSPNVLDLTLVDLPGAVRTVAEGQAADTPQKIQQMILRYISQPNCIILAVSAANSDLAVSVLSTQSQI